MGDVVRCFIVQPIRIEKSLTHKNTQTDRQTHTQGAYRYKTSFSHCWDKSKPTLYLPPPPIHDQDVDELLSKPQPNLNTTVGFDMKMTLQTPPTTHPPTETFQALLDELES